MKVTLESTTRIIEVETPTGTVPARVWEGVTENGVRCFALVTRIAAHKDADVSQFERELKEQRPPSVSAVECWPSRLVL